MSTETRGHPLRQTRPGVKRSLRTAVTAALACAAVATPTAAAEAHATTHDGRGNSVRTAPASHPIGSVISRHRIDVDGDGKADAVTLTRVSEDRVSVSVTTAKRRTSRALVDYNFGSYPPRTPLYGAADMDGTPGKDLVVQTMMGAHTMFFDVLTWRNNRLVQLRNPADPDSWIVDAYAGGAASIRVTGSGLGMRLTITGSELRPAPPAFRFTTTSRTYAWRGGTWKLIKTTHRSDSLTTIPGGWYVRGLPHYG